MVSQFLVFTGIIAVGLVGALFEATQRGFAKRFGRNVGTAILFILSLSIVGFHLSQVAEYKLHQFLPAFFLIALAVEVEILSRHSQTDSPILYSILAFYLAAMGIVFDGGRLGVFVALELGVFAIFVGSVNTVRTVYDVEGLLKGFVHWCITNTLIIAGILLVLPYPEVFQHSRNLQRVQLYEVSATALALLGFLAKASILPMYYWSVDCLSSGSAKLGRLWVYYFALILMVLLSGVPDDFIVLSGWGSEIFLTVGIIGQLLGAGLALVQIPLKRIGAYWQVYFSGGVIFCFGGYLQSGAHVFLDAAGILLLSGAGIQILWSSLFSFFEKRRIFEPIVEDLGHGEISGALVGQFVMLTLAVVCVSTWVLFFFFELVGEWAGFANKNVFLFGLLASQILLGLSSVRLLCEFMHSQFAEGKFSLNEFVSKRFPYWHLVSLGLLFIFTCSGMFILAGI